MCSLCYVVASKHIVFVSVLCIKEAETTWESGSTDGLGHDFWGPCLGFEAWSITKTFWIASSLGCIFMHSDPIFSWSCVGWLCPCFLFVPGNVTIWSCYWYALRIPMSTRILVQLSRVCPLGQMSKSTNIVVVRRRSSKVLRCNYGITKHINHHH
jgi:hypothetical protein